MLSKNGSYIKGWCNFRQPIGVEITFNFKWYFSQFKISFLTFGIGVFWCVTPALNNRVYGKNKWRRNNA